MAKEPWHAVSVVPGADGCPAAIEMRTKRMLSKDAPQLPLANCAWSWKCRCTYRHYSDRRGGARRASELGRPERVILNNRRHTASRRADELIG
jgi:hypothetical protein